MESSSASFPVRQRLKLRDTPKRLGIWVHAPFHFVRRDLLRTRMLLLLKQSDPELPMLLDGSVVEGDIVLENLGHSWFLVNCLPGTLGLACAAIDALVRVDVELVGKCFMVVAGVFVDAVNRTNTHASCIETVSAETCYGPRHLAGLPPPK